MGRTRFLPVLLLSILLLTFGHGFARNLKEIVAKEGKPTAPLKEGSGVAREMIEWKDYQEPEPNFNSRSGYSNIPPPTPHSPAPSPET